MRLCLFHFSHTGIYLLDLIYIDSAYPASDSIIETQQRTNQMNNILRVISDLQVSCTYDHLVTLPHVQKYLMSVRYIEELQKFVEDDNFKLSLKIEPGNSSPRLATSKEDLAGPSEVPFLVRYNRRPTCPDASVGVHIPTPPPSRHRKSHSLGNAMMWHFGVAESKSVTFPSEKARHLLDDSFLESQSPARINPHGSSVSNGVSIGSSQSSVCGDLSPGLERGRMYSTLGPNWRVPHRNSPRGRSHAHSPSLAEPSVSPGEPGVTMQGPVKRKTLMKEGKKPTLASWSRYWISLCGSTLMFYRSKALRAAERKHYKSHACKKVSVLGWMVVLPDDPDQPNIFQLNDPDKGNVYKFQTGDRFSAIIWHKRLEDACRRRRPQHSRNRLGAETIWNWNGSTDCIRAQCESSNLLTYTEKNTDRIRTANGATEIEKNMISSEKGQRKSKNLPRVSEPICPMSPTSTTEIEMCVTNLDMEVCALVLLTDMRRKGGKFTLSTPLCLQYETSGSRIVGIKLNTEA
ncbi:ras-specific guanine nucleotide-releasing factor RalGPS1 [Pimephales promelas]|nr:ras-specific guanine nucleotide-releasing factor RalGPS1 [Pimephales promelas]